MEQKKIMILNKVVQEVSVDKDVLDGLEVANMILPVIESFNPPTPEEADRIKLHNECVHQAYCQGIMQERALQEENMVKLLEWVTQEYSTGRWQGEEHIYKERLSLNNQGGQQEVVGHKEIINLWQQTKK